MEFSFQTVASTPVHGYMQAVSDDGRAVIYRTQDTIYLYYFDDTKIITQNYTLPFHLQKPAEFYTEEHSYHHTVVKVIGRRVLVYFFFKPFHLLKVEFEDYTKPDALYDGLYTEDEILDVAIDPMLNCLVAMTSSYLVYAFVEGEETGHYVIDADLFPNATISGKIYLEMENNVKNYYLFYLQDNDPSELAVLRFHEPEQRQFTLSHATIISFQLEKEFNLISGIDFNEMNDIFVIQGDHVNVTDVFRRQIPIFLDKDLRVIEMEGNATGWFTSWVKGEQQILFGGHSFWDNPHEIFMQEICTASYSYSEGDNTITFDEEKEKCEEGYYDRVSSWVMERQVYLVTHIDRSLTVLPGLGEEELEMMEARAFSTKMADTLIIEQHGELIYSQWNPTKTEEPEPPVVLDPVVELPVALFAILCSVLAVAVILAIVFGISFCRKKPEKSIETKAETVTNFQSESAPQLDEGNMRT